MADIICYKPDGQILDYYTQWDVGQQLAIRGADFSSAPYFYFSNSRSNTAYIMPSEVSEDIALVNVPDLLLQDAIPLIVYISYSPDGDIGTTEYSIRIPVMPRKKPNDYVYNPEQGGAGSPGTNPGGTTSIANNLTTNDPSVALGATQGVVLKSMVEKLDEEKVDAEDLPSALSDAIYDAVNSGIISGIKGDKGDKGDPGEPGLPGDNGVDGAPGRGIVDVVRTSGDGSPGTVDTYTIIYTDNTSSFFSVYHGKDGITIDGPGVGSEVHDGVTFTPHVDEFGNLSWSNNGGLDNPEPINLKGSDGKDGTSITHVWDDTTLVVTSASGTSSANLRGIDGVGITSVRQTQKSTSDNGENVVTVTLSDGTISNIIICNGSKGGDGDPGIPGVGIDNIEQTASSSDDNGMNTFEISMTDGRSFPFNIYNGSKGESGVDGKDGANGSDGVGIKSVKQTTSSTTDGGSNVVTMTLSDGSTYNFTVKNGSKGSTGDKGSPGSNATINGVNTLTIKSGNGISVNQSGSTLTIGSTYRYGTADLVAGSSQLDTGSLYFVYE